MKKTAKARVHRRGDRRCHCGCGRWYSKAEFDAFPLGVISGLDIQMSKEGLESLQDYIEEVIDSEGRVDLHYRTRQRKLKTLTIRMIKEDP